MSDQVNKEYQATPAATLEQQIMDPNFPKNEREWWAAARIEQLEAALREWESAMNKLSMRVGLTPQNIADVLNPIMDTTHAALKVGS